MYMYIHNPLHHKNYPSYPPLVECNELDMGEGVCYFMYVHVHVHVALMASIGNGLIYQPTVCSMC